MPDLAAPCSTETVDRIIRAAARALTESETPMLDARVLAKFAFGLDDVELISKAGAPAEPAATSKLHALIERRRSGEPISLILGEKEFFGLTFKVRDRVLTPRPDSETLVNAVIARRPRTAPLRVLDLGVGSGCLLAALLHAFPHAQGQGIDINPDAVSLAADNLALLGLADRGKVTVASWAGAPAGPFDVIVCNPPYIPDADRPLLSKSVVDYEDWRALFAGPEGLDAYREIAPVAAGRIAEDGLIVIELGAGQTRFAAEIFRAAMPDLIISVDPDLAGRDRALIGAVQG